MRGRRDSVNHRGPTEGLFELPPLDRLYSFLELNHYNRHSPSCREVRVIFRLLAILLLGGASVGQNVVHYTTTNANVKYLFATAEPV
jgi:hypothetical protein